jgi:hypothetical protein
MGPLKTRTSSPTTVVEYNYKNGALIIPLLRIAIYTIIVGLAFP